MYWNGQSLLNWTLSERFELLKKILIKPIKGFFELIDRSELKTTVSDITSALDSAVQEQVEGLISKTLKASTFPPTVLPLDQN